MAASSHVPVPVLAQWELRFLIQGLLSQGMRITVVWSDFGALGPPLRLLPFREVEVVIAGGKVSVRVTISYDGAAISRQLFPSLATSMLAASLITCSSCDAPAVPP